MSVLTKTFVVLLVVTSLLLSASIVVFVNRVEDNKALADASKRQVTSEKQKAAEQTTNFTESQMARRDLQNEMTKQVGELNRTVVDREAEVQKRDGELAQLKKDSQVKEATLKGTADALRAAQEMGTGFLTANKDLRATNDDLRKGNGELNIQITILDNKLRQTEKAREYAEEMVVELKSQLAGVRQKGGPAGAATIGSAAIPEGTADVPINGVVRSVDIIGGKKYATISVGSSDLVKKGMRFNVINRQGGEFLGFLTVDSVQPNEAIGQLEGKVDKIQAGVEVKTQL